MSYWITGMNDAYQLVGTYAVKIGTAIDLFGYPYVIYESHGFIVTPQTAKHRK